MIKIMKKRFEELADQLENIEATKKRSSEYSGLSSDYIDNEMLINWCVKARNLLANVCGLESQHFLQFEKKEKASVGDTNYNILKRLRAVFYAAKEDFEGGYLKSIKNLVQAEVFDNELEQASELLSVGYKTAAAVIAGVVLETTLRNLCDTQGIPYGKLDKMNADLAKKGAYNKLVQKKITALADIRNNAAHGNTGEFTEADVKSMIQEIEKFISDYLP